tara:strand:+ start:400 stop:1269 length:870 start_codon:yes stop_codon:yes gene_type:complete
MVTDILNSLNRGIEKHIYEYNTIVIGSELNAFLYSFVNNVPILRNIYSPPPYFDLFDVRTFGYNCNLYDRAQRDLNLEADKIPKIDVWNYISTLLSLDGLSPLSDKINTIRIQDNLLKVFTNNSKVIKFRFDNLVIFDDRNIEGLETDHERTKGKCRILDWYKVLSGCKHDNKYILDDNDFVKEIHFYPSEKNPKFKHLVAVSYVEEGRLKKSDYSEIYVRYKILDMMEKAGITGRNNGYDKETNKQKRLSLKIEFQEREILSENKILYKEVDNIVFNDKTVEEILKQY